MTLPEHDIPGPALAARLRADAATWGGEVSAATRARLRRIARPSRAPLALGAALAAALLVGASAWLLRAPPQPAPKVVPHFDVARLEAMALAPLRSELVLMIDDGRAVARGMWQQVPRPLRRLLGSG